MKKFTGHVKYGSHDGFGFFMCPPSMATLAG
jgi:hypothetical protein